MKRAPIVITATVAGLAGVLAFHTTSSRLSLGTLPGAAAHPIARAAGGPAARTVDGPAVNYNFGVLSVSVTVSRHKITKIGIASLDDGGMSRSQYIDQQAIPLLEQEAMQAQSANIQGVSGASYTSAGFQQSLQAALHTLGLR